MIFNMVGKGGVGGGVGGGVDTEGMFCWAKFTEEPELPVGYTPLESLALTGANYFILDYIVTTANFAKLKVVADIAITGTSSNNYRIDGCAAASGQFYFGIASNGQYGYSVRSDSTTGVAADSSRHTHTLDVPGRKYTVDSVVNVTTNPNTAQVINKPFIVGGYFDTGYSNAYIPHAETIWSYKFYENGSLVRNYVPALDNNMVACLYDTITGASVYASGTGDIVNGSAGSRVTPLGYVLSENIDAYPQDGFHTDGYYYKRLADNIPWYESGSYVWSKSDAGGQLIEYVVSYDINEFPQDGQGADGYYYKLQEMGFSLKYASGSGSVAVGGGMVGGYNCTITVSNLGFTPKAVYLYWRPNEGNDYESEAIDFNGIIKEVHDLNNGTFTITENGFSFYTTNGLYPSSAVSYSWYALGI